MRIKNPSRLKAQRKPRKKNPKQVIRRKKDPSQSHLKRRKREEKAKLELTRRKNDLNKNDHPTL